MRNTPNLALIRRNSFEERNVIEKQFVKIVRTMRAEIDDARRVSVYVLDNGSLQIEWERPDDDPRSLARYTTKVGLSPESFAVAVMALDIPYQPSRGIVCRECKMKVLIEYVRSDSAAGERND